MTDISGRFFFLSFIYSFFIHVSFKVPNHFSESMFCSFIILPDPQQPQLPPSCSTQEESAPTPRRHATAYQRISFCPPLPLLQLISQQPLGGPPLPPCCPSQITSWGHRAAGDDSIMESSSSYAGNFKCFEYWRETTHNNCIVPIPVVNNLISQWPTGAGTYWKYLCLPFNGALTSSSPSRLGDRLMKMQMGSP